MSQDMAQVIFTGAQGTGKTTILDIFKGRFDNVITEVVRKLSEQGVKINEYGDEYGQMRIFKEYEDRLNISADYISDRCLIDVAAYTSHLLQNNPDNSTMRSIFNFQLVKLKNFFDTHPDIVLCYFPIEFDVVDDGVRSVDEEYRKFIDTTIKHLIDDFLKIKNYHIITGTVEERISQIEKILKNK